MATINSLIPDVRPMIAAAVPDTMMEGAILWSAREFLRKSRWLRETITQDATITVNQYTLTPVTTDTEVFNIQAAQVDGDYLTPATQEEVAPETVGWYFFVPPNLIQLSWAPTATVTDGLLTRVILNVTRTATTIPDSVLDQWDAEISYGALARLFGMAEVAWSDDVKAASYRKDFMDGLLLARHEAEMQSKAYAYGSVQG